MYAEEIAEGVNKALHDELTSAVLYFNMAEYMVGVSIEEFREEMSDHGNEEIGHFKQLLEYAHNHGIFPNIKFDEIRANQNAQDFVSATSIVQVLETEAIALYERLSKLAADNGDIESFEFFKGLMEAEMGHFDDIAKFTGEKRSLYRFDKGVSDMSFDDYLASIG